MKKVLHKLNWTYQHRKRRIVYLTLDECLLQILDEVRVKGKAAHLQFWGKVRMKHAIMQRRLPFGHKRHSGYLVLIGDEGRINRSLSKELLFFNVPAVRVSDDNIGC